MTGVNLQSLVSMIERRYGSVSEECERYAMQLEDRCLIVLVMNLPVEAYTSLHLYGFVFMIEWMNNGDCDLQIELLGGDAMNLRMGGQSKYETQVAEFLTEFARGKGWRVEV